MKRLILICLLPSMIWAQYAPLELPPEWTFSRPTPAYALDAPERLQGNFQSGISVDVAEVDDETGLWRVTFKRYGSPDIHSLIDAPNLAEANPSGFAKVSPTIESFPLLKKMLEASTPWPETAKDLAERLLSKVATSPDGHLYIKDIPMIDQGEKGYCAAATLARVLQFYGYPVDQHAMADLAETEAQLSLNGSGGTARENILNAMSRICSSTPFRLREVTKTHPDEIRERVEAGIPIIWLIPGHMRLLIGIHPEKNGIVFSDSWGMEHRYKTASWDDFVNMNKEMWVLEPR